MGLKSIFALMALFAYIVTASDVLELTESNFDTEGNDLSILRDVPVIQDVQQPNR